LKGLGCTLKFEKPRAQTDLYISFTFTTYKIDATSYEKVVKSFVDPFTEAGVIVDEAV
jgi:hypothetical protein